MNKVIDITVIKSFDGRTYWARASTCVHSFGAQAKTVIVHASTSQSLHRQPVCSQRRSVYIFVDHLALGCNLKGGLFDPPVMRVIGSMIDSLPM